MCGSTQGIGQQQNAQRMRGPDNNQQNSMRDAVQNKGQLGENQLQNYLQGKASGAQQNQQQMDARLLAESMKASGVNASM